MLERAAMPPSTLVMFKYVGFACTSGETKTIPIYNHKLTYSRPIVLDSNYHVKLDSFEDIHPKD